MLFFVSSYVRALKPSLELKEQARLVLDGRHDDRAKPETVRRKRIREELIADHGGICSIAAHFLHRHLQHLARGLVRIGIRVKP